VTESPQQPPLSIFGVTRDKQRVLNKIRAKKDRQAKQTPFTATADKLICKSIDQRGEFDLLVDGVLCRGVHFFTASPRYPGRGTFFPVALFAVRGSEEVSRHGPTAEAGDRREQHTQPQAQPQQTQHQQPQQAQQHQQQDTSAVTTV